MKISFIITVLNEENSIQSFLDSLTHQSKRPSEIIIVDAGSIDSTKKYIAMYKSIKLFTKKGNRAFGRNFAIKKSKGDIIVVSDAGCILDKDFVKNITSPFEKKKIDVVSGFYYPITNNIFEKCLATYTCVMPDKIHRKNFLPSSRSIAFRKNAWEKVKGYPEYLDTCEDLIYAKALMNAGLKFVFQKSAYVKWRQQKSLINAWKQFYGYAIGDGEAGYFRPQTPYLYLRYLLGLLLIIYYLYTQKSYVIWFILICLSLYTLWSIKKNLKYVRNWRAIYYLPALQYVSDGAVLSGTTIGVIKRLLNNR